MSMTGQELQPKQWFCPLDTSGVVHAMLKKNIY